jgi:hypothetical protein
VDVGVEVQDIGAEGSVCTDERLKFREAQRVQSMANDKVYFELGLCEYGFRTLEGITALRRIGTSGFIPGWPDCLLL